LQQQPLTAVATWASLTAQAVLPPRNVVRLTLTIATSSGESWRLVEALRSLMEPTRPDNGCIACELVLSSRSDDPPGIRYVEEWSSEAEIRKRMRSDRFLRLVAVMEEAMSPPQLTFAVASAIRGLDYVVETRHDLIRNG
jgi:quinol monooxygenase YgiN